MIVSPQILFTTEYTESHGVLYKSSEFTPFVIQSVSEESEYIN